MDIQAYKERLQILLESNVISKKSHEVALQAFMQMEKVVGKNDIDQAEMLFTHLPMALSRMDSGEEVEQPAPEVMEEIKQSEHFHIAKEQVDYIERLWQQPLPEAEKDYLYMHYTMVLNVNI